MEKNERKSNNPSGNNNQAGEAGAPSGGDQQPAQTVDPQGSGRASPTPGPTGMDWARPVADQLKPPSVQASGASASRLESEHSAPTESRETPSLTPTDPKEEDPVTDRNGRAPNPPTAPEP
jgi:hypothetical protein